MGIEERTAVAVAQFTLLRRARKMWPNATVGVECTATLSSIHADPAPSLLYIEKGLSSHPGQHAQTQNLNQREEKTHAGDNAVLRSEVVVLALEAPQRPHAVSGLAMPVAQEASG